MTAASWGGGGGSMVLFPIRKIKFCRWSGNVPRGTEQNQWEMSAALTNSGIKQVLCCYSYPWCRVGTLGLSTHYLPVICRKISLGTKKSISANKTLKSSELTLRLEHCLLSWDGPQGPSLRQSLFDPSAVCWNWDVIKKLGIWAHQAGRAFTQAQSS